MRKKKHTETAGKKSESGGFFVKYLWIITAVALVLRLIAAWEMSQAANGVNNVLSPLPTSDLATYMTLGRECAAGDYPETFYYQPYYYAVFLAFCNLISGSSLWMVIFIQGLVSAATVWLTGWCGKRIFSERAGLISAGLCAVSSSLILYVPFCQNETLQTFHLILLLALTIRAIDRPVWLNWLWVGLVSGIAILTRGNIWLLIPFILGGLLLFGRKHSLSCKKCLLNAVIMLCVMLLVQLPFIIRNTMNTGELTGASTAAGAVLALGNTPEAPAGGREPGSTAGPMVYPEAYNRMMANAAGDAPRSVPAQMWDWFCDDAPAFCELQFRKALLFWDAREIPNNVSLDFDGIMASWILRILVIGRNFILFPLGIAGILFFIGELRRKKEPGLIMLYCFSAAFYAAVIVFYILSRFKAPFLPMLILFGGGAISAWWDIYRNSPPEKRVLNVGKIMVFLLIGFWMSNAAYDTYRVCEPAINRWIYPDGIVLDMNGENIHRVDYGPYPFGGWCYQDLKPGDRIVKEFAGMKNEKVQCLLMLQADDAVYVQLTANGIPYSFFMNAVKPPASGRRMLPLDASLSDGKVEIVIKSVSGGKLNGVYDNQRVYDRSMINGKVLDGEWIVRCISDRDI